MKKTDYLIMGYKMDDGRKIEEGKKYLRAKAINTKIFTEKEFEEFLKVKFKNPRYQIGFRVAQMEPDK